MKMTVKKTVKQSSRAAMNASRIMVYLLAFTMTSQPLLAQVQVDQSAPAANQAQIDQAPNGVPVVNIADPSAAGVSRNEFTELNIGQEGLIFNNSREVTDTQLSGFITGNTQLNREATIILNEVNGASRSQLEGFAEVAGQGANLVIANPNGITCDGCGFINTPRTTLSTGQAIISGGDLQGFNVQGGDIAIQGAGLNANGTQQLDLLSRAININAQLQGNQVNAILGRNDVDYDDLSATELEDDGSQTPLFALDASALGALQAGQIRLIGTENGVGINIPTNVSASGGDIQISADGQLVLGGLNATQDIKLTSASDAVELNNTTFAQNVNVSAADDLVVTEGAIVAASDSISIEANNIGQQGDVVAGINRDSSLNNRGQLTLNANQEISNSGQIQATNSTNINANDLTNVDGAQIIGEQTSINVQNVNNQGLVSASQLTVDAQQELNNEQGVISAQGLEVNAQNIDNNGGELESQTLTLAAQGEIDNTNGLINQLADSNVVTGITANELINTNGTIQANSQTLDIAIDNALDNADGEIINVGNELNVNAQSIDNSQGIIASNGNVDVQSATTVANNNGQISGSNVAANAQSIDNQSGSIQAAQTLTVNASNGDINNQQGVIESFSVEPASISRLSASGVINNADGLIQSNNQDLLISSNTVINSASLTASPNLSGGQIRHGGNGVLDITAQFLENLTGASIQSNNILRVDQAASITNTQSSSIIGNQVSLLSTGNIDNQDSLIQANESLSLQADGELLNANGLISQGGTADQLISANGIANQNGRIESLANDLTLQSGAEINNQGGTILHLGDGTLTTNAETLNNEQGFLASNGTNIVTSNGQLNNANTNSADPSVQQGIVGNEVVLQAADVSNSNGTIQSTTNLSVEAQAGALDNTSGSITAIGDTGQTTINAATDINNVDGSIETNNERVSLSAGGVVDNAGGEIIHAGSDSLTLTSQDSVLNSQGQIISNGSINVGDTNNDIANVDNTQGQISAVDRIVIFARSLLNDIGLIQTTSGDIDITASTDLQNASDANQQAQIIAGNNLTVSTPQLQGDGLLQATNQLTLDVTSFGVGNISDLRAGVELLVRTTDFINQTGGSLTTDGSLNFELTGNFTNNGLLSTLNDLNITANTFTNAGNLTIGQNGFFNVTESVTNTGTLTAANVFDISTGLFNNTGAFGSGGDLLLRADSIRNTQGAAIFADGNATFFGQELSNQESDIFITGDLVFAADQDQTLATSFENISGTIESLGSITLFAESLINRKRVFETELQAVSRVFTFDCDDCGGDDFTVDYILREEFNTVVTQDSDAANLIANGDLFIEADDVSNQFSVLAANGDVTINTTDFTNAGVDFFAFERFTTYATGGEISDNRHFDIVEDLAAFNRLNAPVIVRIGSDAQGRSDPFGDPEGVNEETPGEQAGRSTLLNGPNGVRSVFQLPELATFQFENGEFLTYGLQPGRGVTLETFERLDETSIRSTEFVVNPFYRSDRNTQIPTSVTGFFRTIGQNINLTQVLNPNLAADLAGLGSISGAELNDNLRVPLNTVAGVSTVEAGGTLTINAANGINNFNVNQFSNVDARVIDDSLGSVEAVGGPEPEVNTVVDIDVITPELEIDQEVDASVVEVNVETDDSIADLADFAAVNPVLDPDFEFPAGNGLFIFNSDPSSNFLIETNPAFTQFSNFVSSDFFLVRLGFSPDDEVRRLGDSFYEARLIQQAILDATGARFLSDTFTSQNDQLIYLYENAIASQQAIDLTVGTSLTSAQVAALTHDIVWLEEQIVTTPDGRQVTVLAPVLYLASVRPNLVQNNGAVLAGNNVNLISNGSLANSGQINSTNNLVASIDQNIINVGTLNAGNSLQLTAGNNVLNIAASNQDAIIRADNTVSITALNGDIRSERTVDTLAGSNDSSNYRYDLLNGNAGIFSDGNVNLDAANDIGLIGSEVDAQGSVVLNAGRDINIDTLEVNSSAHAERKDYEQTLNRVDNVGSSINAGESLIVDAGNDVNVRGSALAAEGDISLSADNDVNITAAEDTNYAYFYFKNEESSGLSSTTTTIENIDDDSFALVSSISSGGELNINAGNDLTLQAAQVVATDDINLSGENVSITSVEESSRRYRFTEVETSGISTSGLSVTAGSSEHATTQDTTQTSQRASIVGSLEGNVNVNADDTVTVTASDVFAAQDLNVTGSDVVINTADETFESRELEEFSQSGFTLAITAPEGLASTVQGVAATAERASEVEDSRLQALYANRIRNQTNNLIESLDGQSVGDVVEGVQNAGVGISISFGSSESSSESITQASTAIGSNLDAGGGVNITATGDAANSAGDIDITGAGITGQSVALDAANDVNIQSGENSSLTTTENESSSSSIGIGFTVGGESNGLTLSLAASTAEGESRSSDDQFLESTIVGENVSITSGNDTNLVGTIVQGEQVTVDAGGDLHIESQQDTSEFESEQESQSVGIVIPIYGTGGSFNASASETEISANHASVNEQSGIFAGEGGFDVTVGGNTNLVGAAIVSDAPAENNTLDTGTLTFSELENESEFEAESVSVSIGTGITGSLNPNQNESSLGLGGQSGLGGGFTELDDSDSSTTFSALSDAQVTIRDGGTDLTGLADSAEEAHEGPLENVFNEQEVQTELVETQELVEVFSQDASDFIGDLYQRRDNAVVRLEQEIRFGDLSDEEIAQRQQEIDRLNSSLPPKEFAHAINGGITSLLGGGDLLSGAGAGAASEIAGNIVADLQASGGLEGGDLVANLLTGLSGALVGAATGGSAVQGNIIAGNIDQFNRQLHPDESRQLDMIRDQILSNDELNAEEKNQTIKDLYALACVSVQCAEGVHEDDLNKDILVAIQDEGERLREELGITLGISEEDVLETIFNSFGLSTFTTREANRRGGQGTQTIVTDVRFDYSVTDSLNDFADQNEDVTNRVEGGLDVVIGATTTVGGGTLIATGAGLCATTGIGCAVGVPLAAGGGGLAVLGSEQIGEGVGQFINNDIFLNGQQVLDSFSLDTHQGESNTVLDIVPEELPSTNIPSNNNLPDSDGGGILWGAWNDYPKQVLDTPNGPQEFAVVGDRLYSQHAVARLQPSGQRFSDGIESSQNHNPTSLNPITGNPSWPSGNEPGILVSDGASLVRGRSISPNFIEDIIQNNSPVIQTNGNLNFTDGGGISVILSPDGKRVITIFENNK